MNSFTKICVLLQVINGIDIAIVSTLRLLGGTIILVDVLSRERALGMAQALYGVGESIRMPSSHIELAVSAHLKYALVMSIC